MFNRQSLIDFENRMELTPKQKENILLVEKIKKYSVDSLEYLHTKNFTKIYKYKIIFLKFSKLMCMKIINKK